MSVGVKDKSLISEKVFEGLGVPGLGPDLVADIQVLSAKIDKKGDDVAMKVSFDYPDDASAANGAGRFTSLLQVSQGLFRGEVLSRVLSRVEVDVSGHVVTISLDSNVKDLLGEISFGDSDEFEVRLADGRTLRVWDAEELPNGEPQADGGPSLLDVVNITLDCKDYEDESYEYIDACNAVPDEASSRWVAVTVLGSSGTQTFPWPPFGYTVRVMPEGTASVFDPSGASVVTEITHLTIVLLPAQ